jgi:hypothetical protein
MDRCKHYMHYLNLCNPSFLCSFNTLELSTTKGLKQPVSNLEFHVGLLKRLAILAVPCE